MVDSTRSFKDHLFITLTILLSTTFLFIGIASKLNRHEFETKLIDALKVQNINPGIVYLALDSPLENPIPIMRSYELNYLFYRAFGNIKHDVYFVLESTKALEDHGPTKEERDRLTLAQKSSQAMWNMEIYDPSSTKCKSVISMEIKDFAGTLNAIKNTLGLNSGRLNLALDSTKCFK
jgi:hypothetical protein